MFLLCVICGEGCVVFCNLGGYGSGLDLLISSNIGIALASIGIHWHWHESMWSVNKVKCTNFCVIDLQLMALLRRFHVVIEPLTMNR